MPVTQPGYLLGLGSNIDPYDNFPTMVTLLLKHFDRLHLSRVLNLSPVGMNSSLFFLNAVAFIETGISETALKTICNQIESKLGRDRTDPLCKYKDRSADLDILTALSFSKDTRLNACHTTDQFFLYPLIDELAAYLTDSPAPSIQQGCPINSGSLSFGQSATTIYRNRDSG